VNAHGKLRGRGRPEIEAIAVMTQYEVAERLGLSRARVSQLEASALRKLRVRCTRLGVRP